jgi:hypothetical protein
MPTGTPRDHLTPKAQMAARLVAEGTPIEEAAARLGTTARRIQLWMKRPLFQAELARLRESLKTLHDKVREQLEATMIPAAQRLQSSIQVDDATPAQIDSSKFVLAATGHGPINKTVQVTATVNVTPDLLDRLERVTAEAADVAARAGRLLPEGAR